MYFTVMNCIGNNKIKFNVYFIIFLASGNQPWWYY